MYWLSTIRFLEWYLNVQDKLIDLNT